MTDLSNIPTGQLEQMRASNDRTLAAYKASGTRLEAGNAEIDAEIERRKGPDWAAWEPKWQAFCAEASWISPTTFSKVPLIRALIAAHNTPLAGEDALDGEEGWTVWLPGDAAPSKISTLTHEVQWFSKSAGKWLSVLPGDGDPLWLACRYRYRPKQTDEARP